MFSILPRILSIQSHIVHGYVGNKAATFPLQCFGFNVDCINTVHLSNHPAYSGGFKGQMLSGDDFASLVEGLATNDLLGYNILLSGYIRSEDILLKLRDTFQTIKLRNPDAIFVCDPVLGDNGAFYVPQQLLEVYRNSVLPCATAMTPNFFEAQVLSGITITDTCDAIRVCKTFHDLGVKFCLLKGLPLAGSTGPLSMILSSAEPGTSVYRIDFPRVDGSFSGCGDLCTASLTAFLYRHPGNLSLILESVARVMTTVTNATAARGAKELLIVDCIQAYLSASVSEQSSYVVSGPVAGVIFSLEGVLVEHSTADESVLRGIGGHGISRDGTESYDQPLQADRLAGKHAVYDAEVQHFERMCLRPDTKEALERLRSARVRTAVVTRSPQIVLDRLMVLLDDPSMAFHSVVTGNGVDGISAPDHLLRTWGATPGEVWVVGCSVAELACGKLAGCRTCLLVPATALTSDRDTSIGCADIDVTVHCLRDFLDRVLPLPR